MKISQSSIVQETAYPTMLQLKVDWSAVRRYRLFKIIDGSDPLLSWKIGKKMKKIDEFKYSQIEARHF